MKLALAVLVALGVTMAWQASVVADNNVQHEPAPQLTVGATAAESAAAQGRG